MTDPVPLGYINVVIKWTGKSFPLPINPRQELIIFRQQLHMATGVIPSRQRLTYKGRLIKDTTNLSELQLKHGTVIFLVGSNELLEEPLERPRFVEEMSETERQEELARFMDLRERLDDEDRRTAEHFISSFPDMPDFIPYDFTYRAGQITDGRRFIHDLTKRNMEALHINSQAQQLCSACLANNTELAKRLAIGHYSPSSSPLALALSGLLHMRENPLLMAIQQGNLELVRYFIKDGGALINSQSARTGSHRALFVAVQTNREDMVELLVSEGARVDIRDAGGRTPLFLACQIGNIDVVRFLLNQVRGRVDALFTKNERYDWVVSAINRDHVEIVALLMNYKYMRCDYVDPIDHLTPLHKAAKKGSVRVANYLIVEQFMDVNVVAKGKFTPLSLAIGQGGIEMVELLLRHGAKRNDTLAHISSNELLLSAFTEVEVEMPSLKRLCILYIKRASGRYIRQAAMKMTGDLAELFD